MALVSEQRISVVLAVIAAGAHSITAVQKTTGYSLSSIGFAFERLRARGDIRDSGERKVNGAGKTRLVELTEQGRAAARPGEAQIQKSRFAGHRHHANAGAADRVREALIAGPLTAEEIAQAAGLDVKAVRNTLQQLVHTTGGVVCEGPHDRATYRLYSTAARVPVDPERPYRYAQPITRGRGAKWGAGLA